MLRNAAPRTLIAGLLLFIASLPAPADARSLNSGLTVSLERVGYSTDGALICLGFCGYSGHVTVWRDGQVFDGQYRRVSRTEAARFRSILRGFRPTDKRAYVDPSIPNVCPVKVKWPADHSGRQAVACGHYTPGGLFDAVREALKTVHVVIPGL